jgi:hypothetical protein
MTDEKQPEQPQEATQEQQQKVGMAAGQAAMQSKAEGGSPQEIEKSAKEAMRQEADRQGIKIPDEQLDEFAGKVAEQLANPLVDKMMQGFDQRGVFDQPAEPVQAPPAAIPEVQGTEPGADAPAAEQQAEPPHRPTIAEKILGGGR